VVTINDSLTRFSIAEAIKEAKDQIIMDVLINRVILIYGPMDILISDRGTNLCSAYCEEIYKVFGVTHHRTTAARPQSNGITENFNKFIGQNLSIYSGMGIPWDRCVNYCTYAFNTAVHDTTKQAPLYTLTGCHPRMPLDKMIGQVELCKESQTRDQQLDVLNAVREVVIKNIQKRQDYNKRRADHNRQEINFEIGALVMIFKKNYKVQRSAKLKPKYFGHYRVVGRINPLTYEVMTLKGPFRTDVVNVSVIKLYNERVDRFQYPLDPRMPSLSRKRNN
jgi:hypothetical protein